MVQLVFLMGVSDCVEKGKRERPQAKMRSGGMRSVQGIPLMFMEYFLNFVPGWALSTIFFVQPFTLGMQVKLIHSGTSLTALYQ